MRRLRRGRLGSRRGSSGCALVDLGQQVVHVDDVAFGVSAFREDPAIHCRHFDRDLVRFQLDERVARRDGVAFLFQPARYRRLDDRLTERRDFD